MSKYEDGEGRFWIHDTPEDQPFGEHTLGIVDEEEGGIVIYTNDWDRAELLIELLQTTE